MALAGGWDDSSPRSTAVAGIERVGQGSIGDPHIVESRLEDGCVLLNDDRPVVESGMILNASRSGCDEIAGRVD